MRSRVWLCVAVLAAVGMRGSAADDAGAGEILEYKAPRTVDEALDRADFAMAIEYFVAAREERVGYAGLTSAERDILCFVRLEHYVRQGTFYHFFQDPAGDHAIETVSALRAIGARRTADIVDQALDVFPGRQPSRDAIKRRAQLGALRRESLEELARLDTEYRASPEPLIELTRAYVAAHRGEFRALPREEK